MNTSPENSSIDKPTDDGREHWKFRDILSGKILMSQFIRKQFFLFIFLCAIAIFYIDNRYTCELQIAKINKLEDELTNAKYEALTTSTTLMQMSKESQLAIMVKAKGIDLSEPLQPEIEIHKK